MEQLSGETLLYPIFATLCNPLREAQMGLQIRRSFRTNDIDGSRWFDGRGFRDDGSPYSALEQER